MLTEQQRAHVGNASQQIDPAVFEEFGHHLGYVVAARQVDWRAFGEGEAGF